VQVNIDRLYTENIRDSLALKFNVSGIEIISDVENYVYLCFQSGVKRILRITHEERRIRDHIAIELDFISYLVRNGLSCAKPLLSTDNNYIEAERLMMAVYFCL
jgi:Ser/Thr protein kinase RdoA (MazF antagonist)